MVYLKIGLITPTGSQTKLDLAIMSVINQILKLKPVAKLNLNSGFVPLCNGLYNCVPAIVPLVNNFHENVFDVEKWTYYCLDLTQDLYFLL